MNYINIDRVVFLAQGVPKRPLKISGYQPNKYKR